MTEINDRLDRLESQLDNQQQRIDDQQATIEDQQDTIDSQQTTIEAQREQIADLKNDSGTAATEAEPTVLNRRNALKAGGLLALLFGSAGTASADSQGQVGTSSDPLNALYTTELHGDVTNDQSLTDLTGNGLTISSGSLDIESGAVDSAELASDSVTVSAGTGLTGGGSVPLGGSTTLDVEWNGIGPTELANAQFREPTTKTLSPGFDSWTVVDANRPAFLEVEVVVFAENTANGSTNGVVRLSIDESGSFPAEVTYEMDLTGASLPSGATVGERRFRSVYIPAGSQFYLNDYVSASGNSNLIKTVRAIVG